MLNDVQKNSLFLISIVLSVFFFSCKNNQPTPKPRGYYRFDFPVKDSTKQFAMDACAFTFQYPNYVLIEQDTLYFDEQPDHPCWLNIRYDMLSGMVHMSYKELPKNNLVQLTEDYHEMTSKHVIKADFIDEAVIDDSTKNLYGLVSQVGGNVASAYQFYVTDSTNHFVRGALYFRAEANADSLKPAVQFVKSDVIDMIESWEWK